MTQTGDSLHNALAERMNNTVKNGWQFYTEGLSFMELSCAVDSAVDVYNSLHPHRNTIRTDEYSHL